MKNIKKIRRNERVWKRRDLLNHFQAKEVKDGNLN